MLKINMNFKNENVPIYIGANLFLGLPELLKKHKIENNLFFVIDSKVKKTYSEAINEILTRFPRKDSLIVKADEKNKSIEGLQKIYDKLIKKNFGRDTTIVAIGGGIIGDLAGFAAATFARGVKLVHIPTTLLAMVDSSIGGKTGINYSGVKNIVGSFYKPEFILTDIKFLNSLSRADIVSGLGEIVKYSILTDIRFFNFINSNLEKILNLDEKTVQKIISKSAGIKASVVEQDTMESGIRKILNLGHTFAHAYESITNNKLAHGKAVLIGIYSAIKLANKLGYAEGTIAVRYAGFLDKLKSDLPKLNFSPEEVYSIMLNDKKNRDGKIKFVLPINFGELALDVEANKQSVFESIELTNEFLNK
jgi:3-dehydroquinate synthase